MQDKSIHQFTKI